MVFVPLEAEKGRNVSAEKIKTPVYQHLNSGYRQNWLYTKREQEVLVQDENENCDLLQSWRQHREVKGGEQDKGPDVRRPSLARSLAACLHFSANRSVFLTSACFCSLCRCRRVGEEHHCEADEVSDCLLFCFSSHHVWQMNIWCNGTITWHMEYLHIDGVPVFIWGLVCINYAWT